MSQLAYPNRVHTGTAAWPARGGDWPPFTIDLAGMKLPEGDPRCPSCKDDHCGPQKAVVAFGCISRGRRGGNATVIYGTAGLVCDFAEGGVDAGDVWGSGSNDPDNGLMIWEGRIVYSPGMNTPDHPAEPDVDYEGTWREPTDDEWTAIRAGHDPFRTAG